MIREKPLMCIEKKGVLSEQWVHLAGSLVRKEYLPAGKGSCEVFYAVN